MLDSRVEYYGSPRRQLIGGRSSLYSVDDSSNSSVSKYGDGVRTSVSSAASWSSQDDLDSAGELFIWGKGIGDGVLGGGSRTAHDLPVNDGYLPKPVNTVFNVQGIACGVRHAALISKKGEVYTWGEESSGRLGHGVHTDFSHPRPVEALSSPFAQVSCGEYHTVAVSKSGEVYSWGDDARLSRHENNFVSHWTPKRVMGALENVRITSVACGPWHTILISSTGQMFSFGDGTFGVLGHGDCQSVASPREIESLKGLKAVKAACGPWHTAAIVEVMVARSSDSSNSSSGKLFTWGDGGEHRLGHGDKEQKLVPTCVAAVVDYNFREVACGNCLTVCLTTSGYAFTMGSTKYGQLGDPQANGRFPEMLKMGKVLFADISCGAEHVAAVTSKAELYTWGKGANGRLGHGDVEDRSIPTLVEALKDRQLKKVACGSSFTAVICIRKSILGNGISSCTGCKQPFGFKRKKHQCYNCGLTYCHSCSPKKALYAALAGNPRKPHRVCDSCFLKLTTQTSISLLNEVSRVKQGDIKSIATTRRNKRPDSSRVSPMPAGLLQWDTSKSFPQSTVGSRAASPISRRPSPARSATPTPAMSVLTTVTSSLTSPVQELEKEKRKTERLVAEISSLKAEVDKLNRRCEAYERDRLDTSKQIQDAFALAAAETAKCKAAKEVIMSLTGQLKDLAERMPPGAHRMAGYRMETANGVHIPAASRVDIPSVTRLNSLQMPASRTTPVEVPATPSDVETSSRSPSEEWVEQDQPGVYITLGNLPGGGRDLKRVRFSRRRFDERQAESWWEENRHRVYEQYNIRGRASGTPHTSRQRE